MASIRASEQISFNELEQMVWSSVTDTFRKAMSDVLTQLDEALHQARDRERYVLKDVRTREELTLVGPVSFRRRYYWDREEKRWVCLLDEALGIESRQRVSDTVRAAAVEAAVTNTSYRAAAGELERCGCQVTVSHEAIRQWTLKVGKAIEADKEVRQLGSVAGQRRVPVLFVEADGFWPARQRGRRTEARLMVVHEGWERRTPGSKEFRLVKRRDFVPSPGGDAWAEFSAWLESKYDLTDTVIVINGDRAMWIRRGVEWFRRALYQVDRFHLKREVKHYLKKEHPALWVEANQALDANDPSWLLRVLTVAMSDEVEKERKVQLRALIADLSSMPESLRDYRVRLSEAGTCPDGFRGLGAAEGAVERYSQRLRKVGRSWSEPGLRAMLHVMTAYFRGTLHGAVHHLEELWGLESLQAAGEKARRTVVETVGRGVDAVRRAGFPALQLGSNATGGLCKVLRSIAHGY